MNAVPAWTREDYAAAQTNEALNDLEHQLSLLVQVRRPEEWDQQRMVDLQAHALAVCLSRVTAADRRRGNEGPPAPAALLVKLRRWRLTR